MSTGSFASSPWKEPGNGAFNVGYLAVLEFVSMDFLKNIHLKKRIRMHVNTLSLLYSTMYMEGS